MEFVIRVYGVLINNKNEVLLSDERFKGKEFTKFPGGGLQFGEGLKDCLKREFLEELGIQIQVHDLIYVTDFYLQSAFDSNNQVICVYYYVSTPYPEKIQTASRPFQFKNNNPKTEIQRWKNTTDLTPEDLTFPTDKIVAELIKR